SHLHVRELGAQLAVLALKLAHAAWTKRRRRELAGRGAILAAPTIQQLSADPELAGNVAHRAIAAFRQFHRLALVCLVILAPRSRPGAIFLWLRHDSFLGRPHPARNRVVHKAPSRPPPPSRVKAGGGLRELHE